MSYADSLLAKGEHPVWRARQHWLAPLAESRNGLLLFLGGLALAFVNVVVLKGADGMAGTIIGWVILALVVVGLAWMLWVYWGWRTEEYVVTNRRVLKVEGIFNKKSADSSLDKINDAVLTQGIFGRIFGFGDLEILTAADQTVDKYHMLSGAVNFKKAMLNAKNDLEDGYRGGASTPAAAPARVAVPTASTSGKASSDEVTATLSKLADLRDRGAITPAEYEAKKADLLSRL